MGRVFAWTAFFEALTWGGLLLGIFLCETYGVALAPASQAAVLISLCVLFTPLVEWACRSAQASAMRCSLRCWVVSMRNPR